MSARARKNRVVLLLVCLFFLSLRSTFSMHKRARISSRNIFGWQPLMSTGLPKKIRLVGDSSVVQLYIYFLSFCFNSKRKGRNDLFCFLAVLAHMINVCQWCHLPLFDDTSRDVGLFTLRFADALANKHNLQNLYNKQTTEGEKEKKRLFF